MEKGVNMENTYYGLMIECCPFCGGYGKLEKKSKTMIGGEIKYVAYVRCVRCDCRGPRHILGEDPYDARNEAIVDWNRRA